MEKQLSETEKILNQCNALDAWAYAHAFEKPKLIQIILLTSELRKRILMLRFMSAALEKSPRRTFTGKEGALEILGKPISRSGLYNILDENIGKKSPDDFRMAKGNMDTIILLSSPVSKLVAEMRAFYEKIRE